MGQADSTQEIEALLSHYINHEKKCKTYFREQCIIHPPRQKILFRKRSIVPPADTPLDP
jgi:hypothetical protein